jgi:5-formyltetrahydrofolate cyclo-ligase
LISSPETTHALRRRLRAQRAALDAPTRMAAADAVARHFRDHPDLFDHAGYVAGYWAIGGEVPLHLLQLRLFPGQSWCLPVLGDVVPGPLAFAPWRQGDPLVTNRYGIPEPDVAPASRLAARDLHVVLAPLVAFDDRGHRLGMGAGYYDRSFRARAPGAPLRPPLFVGVAYEFQRVAALEPQPWDVPLDAVLTERGLQRFPR